MREGSEATASQCCRFEEGSEGVRVEYLVRKKIAHLLLVIFVHVARACSLSAKQTPSAAMMALRQK